MASWLYQLTKEIYTPASYRAEVFAGVEVTWVLRRDGKERRLIGRGHSPKRNDAIFCYFAQKECTEPGFYGSGVILNDWDDVKREVQFRLEAQSDELKLAPWWDEEARTLSGLIRRPSQGTLFWVEPAEADRILQGISAHLTARK